MFAMKKILVFSIILVLLAISTNASINITDLKEEYDLDESISPIAIISLEQDGQFLLSSKLVCDDFELTYYTQPIMLEEDNKLRLDISPIKISEKTKGRCSIFLSIKDLNDETIETFQTPNFNILEEDATPEIKETEGSEEPKEEPNEGELVKILKEKHPDNSLVYFILFLVALFILIAYLKIRSHFMKKGFNINKGWRLHKRRN
jgi:hypothetical protein